MYCNNSSVGCIYCCCVEKDICMDVYMLSAHCNVTVSLGVDHVSEYRKGSV